MFLWRLVVKGFLLVCYPSVSRLSRIFEEKQEPSTSAKEQVTLKEGISFTCVFASSQWFSSSLSRANERRFVRSFPQPPPPSLPHLLIPSPTPQRPVGEKFHSWLTAARLCRSASSSTPLGERERTPSKRAGSLLIEKMVWRDKGIAGGLWTKEQQPVVTQR